MTWCDFLVFMQSVEGIVAGVLGIGLSYIVEYVPGFEALVPKWKRVAVLLLCVVFPVLALLLAWATGCVAQPTGEMFWQAVQSGGVAFAGSQFAHMRELEPTI